MNGKGRAPEKGYNRAAYRTNYDAIFRQQLKTMKTNQPGLEQPTVLPWHYDAAREINNRLNTTHYVDLASLIARHDPAPLSLVEKKIAYLQAQHETTLRLLREALEHIENYDDGMAQWMADARAHLAAHRQTAQAVGGGK